MKTGIELIAEERKRQLEVKGWTHAHDATHVNSELAIMAALCACDGTSAVVIDDESNNLIEDEWLILSRHGWDGKVPDRVRLLSIAGALIAAEIDREQLRNKKDSK